MKLEKCIRNKEEEEKKKEKEDEEEKYLWDTNILRKQKMKVEKAIFPIAGLATRFYLLSKVISKELLPLVDKPLVNYTLKRPVGQSKRFNLW